MNIRTILYLLPFLLFLIGYGSIAFIFKTKKINMPNIIGLSIDKALIVLDKHHLHIRIIEQKENTDLPDLAILNQHPAPGSLIKQHQMVYVVINKKSNVVQIPNFEKCDIQSAKNELDQKGIACQIYHFCSDKPTNQCIAQLPEKNLGSDQQTVILYASSPKRIVLMPNCINQTVQNMTEFLSLHGINPSFYYNGYLIAPNDYAYTHYHIIDQRPAAGTILVLDNGKPVHLQFEIAA